MLMFLKIFVLVTIQITIVKCLSSRLAVRKVDRKVVLKKRQDTMELCRLFNQETQKQKYQKMQRPQNSHRRAKRNIDDNSVIPDGNPFVKVEDLQKVEKIVDKLYDELEENGKKVSYRQRPIPGVKNAATSDNKTEKSGRRFDFAPKILLGPAPMEPSRGPDNDVQPKIPWRKVWLHGVIPYFIDPKTYDSHLAKTIVEAFDYFERVTCIRLQRLREKPIDKKSLQYVEWVYITNPTGIRQCVHSNERRPNKGVQIIVFGYDCMSRGEIVHEVMHILGFSHEHTRPDRDQHISIAWENIKPGYRKYFELRNEENLMHLPYDYESVLHYPQRAFSRNGKITINAAAESLTRLGQREGLSDIDAEKVSLIFGMDCVERNKEYLVSTCPIVIKTQSIKHQNVTPEDVAQYFEKRIWPFGVVNYKIRDIMEFSLEEKENIKSVLHHIEQETCIEFRDMNEAKIQDEKEERENEEEEDEEGKDDNDNDDEQNDPENDKKGSNEITPNGDGNEENPEENISPSPANDENASETTAEGLRAKNGSKYKPSIAKSISKTVPINNIKTAPTKKRKRKHRVPKKPLSPMRRHATSSLILVRSAKPGCQCPETDVPSGDKMLEINADCFNSVNDLLHLFVHVLGLDHQHNAHDRDSYLHIVWDKLNPVVKADMEHKLPPQATLGLPYDYQSVMHFPWLEIKDGVTNIMYPVWNDGWSMGHWQGLSYLDVQKINTIYQEQCAKRKDYVHSNS